MKSNPLFRGLAILVFLTMLSVVTAFANSNRGGGPGNGPQGPPPEAIKACEGKQVGDSVSFAGREGEALKATCQTVEGQLVAVPEGHKLP